MQDENDLGFCSGSLGIVDELGFDIKWMGLGPHMHACYMSSFTRITQGKILYYSANKHAEVGVSELSLSFIIKNKFTSIYIENLHAQHVQINQISNKIQILIKF